MIDDKKIEEACDRALKRSVFNDNVHAYTYVNGFYIVLNGCKRSY